MSTIPDPPVPYDAALDFFGLRKDPLPEIEQAADQVAPRPTPDPVQRGTANGTPRTAPTVDPRDFFGLRGHNPVWQPVTRVN